jgi:hypothetical protein
MHSVHIKWLFFSLSTVHCAQRNSLYHTLYKTDMIQIWHIHNCINHSSRHLWILAEQLNDQQSNIIKMYLNI